ncbi:FAD-dependent oxidoreductase [Achromobacter sp. SD115]|uniref:NAD(P)/FAD-dependent oxidoreductase n=1 Tax=Achromobacter sp. SD115 TaxID=2782011 RepID=UPI001A96D6C9|nr:NAD(P)/FAD-dependent oxidoreductase [Achromobacter sp. SD115]MBO1018160.1 FAD-dependent oxidoreductase [Achromobacter sp. SD115]
MKRRSILLAAAAGAALAAAPIARAAKPHVVVVGGGYGGATAARYLRLLGAGAVDVTLVDENPVFVSCPLSNLVLGGSKSMADITVARDGLSRHGVRLLRDRALAIDAAARQVRLTSGERLSYDRLILSPGVDMQWQRVDGMDAPGARERVLHAWKAGAQTAALRRQLEAMPDGGNYVLTIPLAPYRCPPAPYERACQVAWYFKQHKPRSKVLVFDANADITSKAALFRRAWADSYADYIEYTPQFEAVAVDAAGLSVQFELGETIRADVLNVVPPMRAAAIAVDAGLATANDAWCEVDFLTFESLAVPGIHVLGDAIQVAPAMPKSGHMANQHGKTCAAAVLALLGGGGVNPLPLYANTCYSYTSDREVMHVASVHRYDAAAKTMLPVAGAGGLSAAPNARETPDAQAWAQAIWGDMLG